MRLKLSGSKTHKKADVRQRMGGLTLTAEDDKEEVLLAWLYTMIAGGYLQNIHSTAHASIASADSPMNGLILCRSYTTTIRAVKRDAKTATNPE